jgi:hypothetical protein
MRLVSSGKSGLIHLGAGCAAAASGSGTQPRASLMLLMYCSRQLWVRTTPGIQVQGGLVCAMNWRSLGHFHPAIGALGSGM